MNKKIDQNKCYKIKLKSILNKQTDHEKHLKQINEIVINFNKLISDTYDFIKLYYLFQYESISALPIINEDFIYSIMKILGILNSEQKKINKKENVVKKHKTELDKSLYDFYINYYNKNLNHTRINISKADNLLKYSSITILTMITNNIKQRFIKHLNRFINITTKDLNLDYKQLNSFKNALFFNERDQIHPIFNNWMELYSSNVLPNEIDTNVHYDVEKDPFKYIPCMIFMNKILTSLNQKTFNVFPSKRTNIPGHIIIDTNTLVGLLNIDLTDKNKLLTNYICCNNYSGILKKLWSKVFNMKKSIFKNKNVNNNGSYVFNYMIQTDGYSCSLVFVKKNNTNKEIDNTKRTISDIVADLADSKLNEPARFYYENEFYIYKENDKIKKEINDKPNNPDETNTQVKKRGRPKKNTSIDQSDEKSINQSNSKKKFLNDKPNKLDETNTQVKKRVRPKKIQIQMIPIL